MFPNISSSAFDNRLSVCILKLADGLDYGKITEEDEAGYQSSADLTLTHPSPRGSNLMHNALLNRMMHADSNLSISELGVHDSVGSSYRGPSEYHYTYY